MKYLIAALIGIWVFFVGAMICSAVHAQELPVPLIQGTIHIMYEDGTTKAFTSDRLFMTPAECYAAGMPTAAELVAIAPVIAMFIQCEPVGEDI